MTSKTLPPRSVLRARLARGIQLGVPEDQIRGMRSAYHARALGDRITEVADRLLPEHRAELAELLTGGDRDAA
jgi:hypothetical protein